MLKNFLKITWRTILRNKATYIVNVLGLSLGICACIVIYIITSFEFSFDTFHPDKNRIYRVMGDVTESTGNRLHFARVPTALVNGRNSLTGLDAMGCVIPYNAPIKILDRDNSSKQFESRIDGTYFTTTVVADPQYFEIFKYKWLAGNASTSLKDPFAVVLTESKAKKYFNEKDIDKVIGKQVMYADSLFTTVTGVVKDWQNNSDLNFTDFISFPTIQSSFLKNSINTSSWKQNAMSAWVFAKLKKGSVASNLDDQLGKLVKTNAEAGTKLDLWLDPISSIHFNADVIENPIKTAHKPTLYSLIAIALFILILAIINFINLSTAQSIRRAKEVGVRKVLGSSKTSLVVQFLADTFLLSMFSVLIALLLVNPVLSLFRSFIPEGISFHLFELKTIFFLLTIIIVTTILAGFYPARVLSSYLPAITLKGSVVSHGNEKWMLRKGLILFQFTVSLVFIIGSIVIERQLKFLREKDLGFTADAIVTIDTPRGDSLSKVAVLNQSLQKVNGISKTAMQWLPPMTGNPREMKIKYKATDQKDFWVKQIAGDENFISLYGMKLIAGGNLVKTDTVSELVINETLSKMMGDSNPSSSIGKTLYWNDKTYPIVGVIADFHTKSLHETVTPLCVINRKDRESSIAIKLVSAGKHTRMVSKAISDIEYAWKQVYPSANFNYKFYDESLALLYEKDAQTAKLINASTGITIFISCIGLFGLALFTVERRSKEISIRKILGASSSRIAAMLTNDFILLVIIATFIASPIAWYFSGQWLQSFAYRVNISWWIFLLAGAGMLLITFITISLHAIRAAIVNPVKNLRAE